MHSAFSLFNKIIMITKKTYAANGFVEWSVSIPLSGNSINIPFSGGSFTELGVNPATFSTANPLIQSAIENSLQYKDGRITVLKVLEIPSDEDKTVVSKDDSKSKVYRDVTNMQQAKELLRIEYGVSLAELQTKKDVIDKASSLNVAFPNYK